jgi:flagellar export protein FliJ
LKAFVFSLETLRRLRVQTRKQAEVELQRISGFCARITAAMQTTQARIEAGHQTNDPAWISQEQAFLACQRGRLERLASELLDARREEAQWRQALAYAQQQEEVVENLREAQHKRWRKNMLKEEQKILDDLPASGRQKKRNWA